MKRYVKVPAPGQLRGEGEWNELESLYPVSVFPEVELREKLIEDDWSYLVETGYLPTKEE